jgi:hypothetical protein
MSADRMNQIIRELKRQAAGEKLEPEQLKGLIRAGYVYRNGEEHHLTDMGREAVARSGVHPSADVPSAPGLNARAGSVARLGAPVAQLASAGDSQPPTTHRRLPAGDGASEINSSVEWAASLAPV